MLIFAIKPKVKEEFYIAAILQFYILQKFYLNKSCMLLQYLLPHIIAGP
jgi:hypothetical protein